MDFAYSGKFSVLEAKRTGSDSTLTNWMTLEVFHIFDPALSQLQNALICLC